MGARTDLCTIHEYGDPLDLSRRYATPESSVTVRPHNRPVYVPGYGYSGEPILISEFGGIAFSGEEGGWGYTTVADAEQFLEPYEALISTLLHSETVCGFCYTQRPQAQGRPRPYTRDHSPRPLLIHAAHA